MCQSLRFPWVGGLDTDTIYSSTTEKKNDTHKTVDIFKDDINSRKHLCICITKLQTGSTLIKAWTADLEGGVVHVWI